jgi:hypothetical protein
MGYYVHLNVCFACDENEGVAALAKQYQPLVVDCQEAKWFLEDVGTRTGHNPGPKGGLLTWGIIGNYTNVEDFVHVLQDFWTALLQGDDGGPLTFEHILVFYENEGSEAANAYEIFLDDNEKLQIKHHKNSHLVGCNSNNV